MMSEHGGRKRRRLLGFSLALVALVVVLGTAFVVRQGLQGGPARAEANHSGGVPSALAIEEVLRGARSLLSQGEFGKAGALLKPAVEAAGGDQDLRLAYAEALLGQGDFAGAHDQFVAAIVIGPDAAAIRFDAAGVAFGAGLLEEAEEHYWEAQRLDPTDARYALYLAQLQRKLGKNAEAKKNLLLAAQLDEGLDIAWGVLADIALEENKLSLARGYVARAREISAGSMQWRLVEARIERRDNRPEVALGLLMGTTVTDRAREPMVLREMALALGLLGRPGEAAGLYADASALAGGEVQAVYLREAAEWFERAGMIDEAIVYASRAARGGDEAAGGLLDRLEESVRESAAGGDGGE